MIESSILITSNEPTTSRIWALCVTELHCRPLVANSIEQAVNIIEESSSESHSLESGCFTGGTFS